MLAFFSLAYSCQLPLLSSGELTAHSVKLYLLLLSACTFLQETEQLQILCVHLVQGGGWLYGAALQGDNLWGSQASLRWKEEFVHSQPTACGTHGGELQKRHKGDKRSFFFSANWMYLHSDTQSQLLIITLSETRCIPAVVKERRRCSEHQSVCTSFVLAHRWTWMSLSQEREGKIGPSKFPLSSCLSSAGTCSTRCWLAAACLNPLSWTSLSAPTLYTQWT